MNSPTTLTGSHLRTYQTIFQHPISHNLGWHDVHSLFRHLGNVDEEPNGNLKVTRNGQILVLHPPRTKDVDETDELMALRHFLKRSEPGFPGTNGGEDHWLLVIDHDEARVFRTEMHGAIPQKVVPHEANRYFRRAHKSGDFPKGEENPEQNGYFEPVAKALETHGKILVFGSGTGRSNEMDQFIGWAKFHHPELAARVIGSVVVDEHHSTEPQLLAKARDFYATVPVS